MSVSKILLAFGFVGAAVFSTGASANVNLSTAKATAGPDTPESGATTVTFDTALYPTGISYSGGFVANGSVGSEYAAPPGASGNYFTVGTSAYKSATGTATFSGAGATYFGFYLGSPDSYNSVTYYGSDGTSTTFTGTQLVGYTNQIPPIGDNGVQTQGFYFGIKAEAGTTFTKVSFNSSSNAMETDNHSFILASAPVPEPETYAMLMAGLALVGVIGRRRKQRA